MSTIGKQLKALRESQGLERAEVSRSRNKGLHWLHRLETDKSCILTDFAALVESLGGEIVIRKKGGKRKEDLTGLRLVAKLFIVATENGEI